MNEPNDVVGRVLAGGRIRSDQERRVVAVAVRRFSAGAADGAAGAINDPLWAECGQVSGWGAGRIPGADKPGGHCRPVRVSGCFEPVTG